MFSTLEQARKIIEQKDRQNEDLLRRVYGRRSEKLHPGQLMLDPLMMEALNQPDVSSTPLAEVPEAVPHKKTKKRNRPHPGRIPIPEHLGGCKSCSISPKRRRSARTPEIP